MWDWLGKLADFASLASLLVSGYAAWQITAVRRKVSRRVAFTALADDFLDRIGSRITSLGEAIRCYPDKRLEIVSDIRECVALLGAYEAELSRDGANALSELRHHADRYRGLIVEVPGEGTEDDPSTLLALLWNIHGLVRNCWVDYQNVIAQRRNGVIDDL
ncbi:MAG: hypothetical protein WCO00_08440 [Rhodospirillaceae bacterium]